MNDNVLIMGMLIYQIILFILILFATIRKEKVHRFFYLYPIYIGTVIFLILFSYMIYIEKIIAFADGVNKPVLDIIKSKSDFLLPPLLYGFFTCLILWTIVKKYTCKLKKEE